MVPEEISPRHLRFGAGALLLLVLLLLGPLSTVFHLGIPPCEDDLAFSTPRADMTIDANSSTETITVTHEGGETVAAEDTVRLSLRFEDAETGKTATVTWAPDGTGAFPVESGESVTIHWKRAGPWMDTGDTVRVIWRGYETNRPQWCLGNRPGNSTFAKATL